MSKANVRARRPSIVVAAVVGVALAALLVFLGLRSAFNTKALAEQEPATTARPTVKETPRPATITLVTRYPGLYPQGVEKLITNRVERWLGELPGVASSASKSIEGVSLVELTLSPDANPALVLGQANALVVAMLAELPPGSTPPVVQMGEPGGASPLGILAVQNPALHEFPLSDIVRSTVRSSLARLTGIRVPMVLGGMERRFAVYLDRRRTEARNLTLADVFQVLQKHLASPASALGAASLGEQRVLLVAGSAGTSLAEWGDLPLRSDQGGVIALRDVAVIEEGAAQTSAVRLGGQRAICLPLFAAGATAPSADEIRKAVSRLQEGLPEGTALTFLPCGGVKAGDPSEITVFLRAPTPVQLGAMEQRVSAFERFLEDAIPAEEREWVVSELGVRADASALYSQNSGPQDATIRVRLSPRRKRSAAQHVARLRQSFAKVSEFADLKAGFHAGPINFSAFDRGGQADLVFRIRGEGAGGPTEVAREISQRIAAVAGVASAQIRERLDARLLMIEVDGAKAALMGLSAADVLRQVAEALDGTALAGIFWTDPKTGDRCPVVVGYPPDRDRTLQDVLETTLKGDGIEVAIKLPVLVALREGEAPAEIDHVNGSPVLDVLIDVDGKSPDAVAGDLEKLGRERALPGITMEVRRLLREAGR